MQRAIPPTILSLVMAVSLAMLMLVPASRASAHARLERADPAPESTVAAATPEVRIWTTQELTLGGNALTVTDADGTRVDNGDAQVDQRDPDRKQLVVTLPPLTDGTYTVNYTTTSAEDGDTFDGSYWFTVAGGASDASPLALTQESDR